MTSQTETHRITLNWPGISVLVILPIIMLIALPMYLWHHSFSTTAWVTFGLFMAWSGLGITAGYHRLWAHRTYEAAWPVRFILMIGGTLAIQNSILFWASGHRTHHRHVDDVDLDPYSAKRGFWFSHVGWMLRNHKSGVPNYKNAPDLLKDPMVMFQDKYYIPLVILTNVGFTMLIGWAAGDLWGTFLLAGLVRIFLTHQMTFFINSLAHMFGKQPYTDENTARDNFWMALLTWGEGYHNYHHIFQYDYRNGVKWWQFDPTKWLISALSAVGLTYNLKRIPDFTIRKAEVAMKFKRAEQDLATYGHNMHEDMLAIRQRISQEYEEFCQTLNEWAQLKEQSMKETKSAVVEKIHQMDTKLKMEFQLIEQRMHAHGERIETMMSNFKRMMRQEAKMA